MALTMSINAVAETEEHGADGLVALPHLMKVILENNEALKIDAAQQKKFDTIMQEVPLSMHTMMQEAEKLEHSIKKDVMHDKKTNAEVKVSLEKLQIIKYKISTLQIATINKLQKILSEAQYKKLIKIMRSKKRGKAAQAC